MESCPPYTVEDPNSWYFITLDVIFCLSVIVNVYVFYCIIFLSSRQMKTYRWYLLWHQILVFSTDITINFLGQPIIFYPFRMGYPAGVLKSVIPSAHFVSFIMFTLFFGGCSDAHLFLYRLVTIKGYDNFPWLYKIWAGVPYLLSFVVIVLQMFIIQPNQEATIQKYGQIYTCVNGILLDIPNFIIYDEDELKKTEKLQWATVGSICVTMSICFFLSLKATTTKRMSSQLVKLQRKFLRQLVVLIFVPLAIVALPGLTFAIINDRRIYGYNTLGLLVIAVCSTVSTIGGIALVLMNPTYQAPFRRHFKRGSRVSTVVSSNVKTM